MTRIDRRYSAGPVEIELKGVISGNVFSGRLDGVPGEVPGRALDRYGMPIGPWQVYIPEFGMFPDKPRKKFLYELVDAVRNSEPIGLKKLLGR